MAVPVLDCNRADYRRHADQSKIDTRVFNHYDISKLGQWEQVFAHAQRSGIHLHFVLNESEEANKRELDNGELGVERMLYYRELIASRSFGRHTSRGA